jgi:hypothetical protein
VCTWWWGWLLVGVGQPLAAGNHSDVHSARAAHAAARRCSSMPWPWRRLVGWSRSALALSRSSHMHIDMMHPCASGTPLRHFQTTCAPTPHCPPLALDRPSSTQRWMSPPTPSWRAASPSHSTRPPFSSATARCGTRARAPSHACILPLPEPLYRRARQCPAACSSCRRPAPPSPTGARAWFCSGAVVRAARVVPNHASPTLRLLLQNSTPTRPPSPPPRCTASLRPCLLTRTRPGTWPWTSWQVGGGGGRMEAGRLSCAS